MTVRQIRLSVSPEYSLDITDLFTTLSGYLLLTLPITQLTSTHLLINQKLFIKHLPCARQHFRDRNMVVSKGDKALVLSPHLSVALISPLNVDT